LGADVLAVGARNISRPSALAEIPQNAMADRRQVGGIPLPLRVYHLQPLTRPAMLGIAAIKNLTLNAAP